MSVLTLKIFGIICMLLDHIRYTNSVFDTDITRVFGRIAFPIFAFLISEGAFYTKDIKKYEKRLFIFALISQLPYTMFCRIFNIMEEFQLNIFFTLLSGLLLIEIYQNNDNNIIKILKIILGLLVVQILNMDYGLIGVLAILNFYILRDKKINKYIIYIIILWSDLLVISKLNLLILKAFIPYFIGCLLSVIPLSLYNGELGKYKLKGFFYAFYPLHLLIFCIINYLL